ncbi:MAG: hypothetical protein MJ168_09420 [Clostridia bacterium]|nr:hypothetical protein [Clostridia bacterium]
MIKKPLIRLEIERSWTKFLKDTLVTNTNCQPFDKEKNMANNLLRTVRQHTTDFTDDEGAACNRITLTAKEASDLIWLLMTYIFINSDSLFRTGDSGG